jgi:hypothetical protein
VVVWLVSISQNKSFKTHLSHKMPPVGRNWQLIFPYRTIHLAQFNADGVSFSALFTFWLGGMPVL